MDFLIRNKLDEEITDILKIKWLIYKLKGPFKLPILTPSPSTRAKVVHKLQSWRWRRVAVACWNVTSFKVLPTKFSTGLYLLWWYFGSPVCVVHLLWSNSKLHNLYIAKQTVLYWLTFHSKTRYDWLERQDGNLANFLSASVNPKVSGWPVPIILTVAGTKLASVHPP